MNVMEFLKSRGARIVFNSRYMWWNESNEEWNVFNENDWHILSTETEAEAVAALIDD